MPGVNADFKQIFGVPMEQSLVETTFGAPGLILFPNDYDILEVDSYDERQIAAFGQADFDITPKFHISAGARYATARAVLNFNDGGFYNSGNPVPYNKLDHFYTFTPKFAVSYDVTPESNIYASASEGSRFGGEGNPIPFGPNSVCAADDVNFGVTSRPGKFQNDKLWSYEIGTKNRLDGNRLSIDAAAYYIDWKNLQQQIFLPICGFPFTANVGNAEVYGGELAVQYTPINGLVLGLTANVDDATIVSTTNSLTAAVGEDLIDVPKWTMALTAEYSLPITDEIMLVSRADFTQTGHSHGTYQVANSNFENPAYGVLNASVGITTDLYDLSLYAKNLTNDRTILQRPEINDVVTGYTMRPLTIGVTGKMRF
jgi:outer membrane receptor protein involved in Fe transport